MDEKGLTSEEVKKLQLEYGKNELEETKKENFFIKILHIICEPMFLLLLIAATIYFILGNPKDGFIMLIFVVGIISIDIIQEWKTDKTLSALKTLSEPKITVLRDGEKKEILSSDLVPGDIMYVYEGIKIPADGVVIKCSGLQVDESSLTGESLPVLKTQKKYNGKDYWRDDYCYQGTLVVGGTGIIKVDRIGSNTEYGKIGKNISEATEKKTLLQHQTDTLVKYCAIFALILFIAICLLTFFELKDLGMKERIVESILSAVTLAMAMIPEEFPVVLTVFLSMGAWRLARKNSLVKKLPAVETLGAITVLCVDKTGTITKNQMEITNSYFICKSEYEMVQNMCLASEEETYDPMEKAMFKYAKNFGITKQELFKTKRIKNYPFSNDTKIVGNAYLRDNKVLLTAKGSPENIIKLCNVNEEQLKMVNNEITYMQKKGLRVIAIAHQEYKNENKLPKELTDATMQLDGLVGLIDPPRENIINDIETCNKAGVRVVMITGDNGVTASSIAKSIGMQNTNNIITGEMIDKMSFEQLKEKVKTVSIFSRVIPEHKMKIVKAFQSNGEIVAMTGDGVNDAPALKQAEIGIAMGGRGSEVSREAADLILLDDNFTTIVDTIKDGRRIYDNIKKAVGYIFVIHIPIAFSSLLGPLLGIIPSNLMLLPLHVVLLELIIDPTCSIVLERQPAENNIMDRKPRKITENIADKKTLIKSIIQGLVIFATSFISYYYIYKTKGNVELARTISILIIMFSNIFLVEVNSSDSDYVYEILGKLLKDQVITSINTIIFMAILIITYTPINSFLQLQALSLTQLLYVIITAFVSTFWYEIIKFINNKKEI